MFHTNSGRVGIWVSAVVSIALAACSGEPNSTQTPAPFDPGVGELPEPPPFTGTNPVDAATHTVFFRANHVPKKAPTNELCRRLYADLLGRYPTTSEVARDCEGREVGAIVTDLQSRDEYIVVSERRWRDRFNTNDVMVNWRYLNGLYDLVDQLHRSELTYGEFVTRAVSHPGFLMTQNQPEDRARSVYRAFLGREATDAEAADFASLLRPWIPQGEPDPEIRFAQWIRAYVYPIVCQPLLHCQAKLLGGGEVDLRGGSAQAIPYEELPDWMLTELAEPGRVIARQPILWEAAADEILNRYLRWSDGGRFPREPGIVLPEVRQALAEHLATNGDYRAAERIVLTSSLYTQPAEGEPDGLGDDPDAPEPPIWASGPVKPADAEVWLDSALRFVPDRFGTCDSRFTDGFVFFSLFQAANTGTITPSQLETELARVQQLIGSRMTFMEDPNLGIQIPDFRYLQIARLIGGCPGFQSERLEPKGMAYAYTHESIAELICQPNVATMARPQGNLTVENILTHQMQTLFARAPVAEELAAFEDARATCTGLDCSNASAVNSVCVGLLGSAEMVFY